VLELDRRTGLKVEGLLERTGLFAEGSMTTLHLGVGHLEVRGIVVSVARLGRVEFVYVAWGLGLWDMVDLDMTLGLRHRSCMT